MPRRKMLPGQLRNCRVVSTLFFAVFSLVMGYETRPLVGLDLVEDRTTEMMESIKADMSINFMEAALLQATARALPVGTEGDDDMRGLDEEMIRADTAVVFPSYSLTDADGVVHTCTVREEAKAKSPYAKTNTRTNIKTKTKTNTNTEIDVSTALDPLEGACATLADGYWTYKWCHRRDVIQFHDDVGSTATVVVDLGTYARTEVKRANASPTSARSAAPDDEDRGRRALHTRAGDGTELATDGLKEGGVGYAEKEGASGKAASKASKKKKAKTKKSGGKRKSGSDEDDLYQGINNISELTAVVDFYEGGDFCEETGEKRSLKTSITCCPADRVPVDFQDTSPVAVLVSIQEISTCSYLAKVCSRLLCPAAADELAVGQGEGGAVSSGVGALATEAGGVLGILQELEACFPPKKDTWWSYKLCLLEGMSQYHEDLFQKTDGTLVSKVTDEYSLGEWDRSTVTDEGEDLIRREQGTDGEAGAIVLEFTGGTECDLTGVLRSATVHLKCGIREEVKEVIEDRTCHYRVLAFSPFLCSHPALVPKKAAVRTVECVSEGESRRDKLKGRASRGADFLRRVRDRMVELGDMDQQKP